VLAAWPWQSISCVGLWLLVLAVGAGLGDDVVYGVFDWVDLSGILLVIALIGAVGLAWLWPGSGE
jgi:hypothetical protein